MRARAPCVGQAKATIMSSGNNSRLAPHVVDLGIAQVTGPWDTAGRVVWRRAYGPKGLPSSGTGHNDALSRARFSHPRVARK